MRSIRSRIFTLLAISWMVVIFVFSAQDADESSANSNEVGMLLGHLVVEDFDVLPQKEKEEFADTWDYPIRKAAHMTEYALLGFLLVEAMTDRFCALEKGKKINRYKLNAAIAFGIAVLYAASDEIHQYFVPGRACMAMDVVIDSVGALIGVGIVTIKRFIVLSKNTLKEIENS